MVNLTRRAAHGKQFGQGLSLYSKHLGLQGASLWWQRLTPIPCRTLTEASGCHHSCCFGAWCDRSQFQSKAGRHVSLCLCGWAQQTRTKRLQSGSSSFPAKSCNKKEPRGMSGYPLLRRCFSCNAAGREGCCQPEQGPPGSGVARPPSPQGGEALFLANTTLVWLPSCTSDSGCVQGQKDSQD